jgi:hypothetical protein
MIYRKLKRLAQITQVSLLIFIAAGCGYTSRCLLADKYKTIHISPFTNKVDITDELDTANKYKIYKPQLDSQITQLLIDRFIKDGTLRVEDAQNSDLTLEGELVEFRREPLRYDRNDEVIEYRLALVVNIYLKDKRENKIILEENNFTGETTYFVTGNLAKSEDVAINDAVGDLARRVVERVIEQW